MRLCCLRRAYGIIAFTIMASSPAAALTSKFDKYLAQKPVIGTFPTTLSPSQLERCLVSQLTMSVPGQVVRDGPEVSVFAYQVTYSLSFVRASVTFDERTPSVLTARGKLGRAAAKKCAG